MKVDPIDMHIHLDATGRSPHLEYAHRVWARHLRPGARIIDATVGNGRDAEFLASLLQGKGELFVYDIQEQAIENSRLRLQRYSSDFSTLHIAFRHQSHESFLEEHVDLIVYNLGYLPGGNKEITTKVTSTLASLASAQQALSPQGAISVMCYPGHLAGKLEEQAVQQWAFLQAIDWSVQYFFWNPGKPSWFWIKKLGSPTSI